MPPRKQLKTRFSILFWHRKAEKKLHPKLTYEILAELLSEELGREIKGGTLREMASSGYGLNDAVLDALEKVLDVPEGWLRYGDTERIPEASLPSEKRKPDVTNIEVSVFRGGSSAVWVMDPKDTFRFVVRRFSGGSLQFVQITDASLWPKIDPLDILAFAPFYELEQGKLLLVQSKADAAKYAIRRYEPDDNGGHFSDKKGVYPPLPSSEWVVVGKAMEIHSRNGLNA